MTPLPLRTGGAANDVQGNVLAGFNKPHMHFLIVQLPRAVTAARAWLGEIAPRVACTREVAEHNALFRARRADPRSWLGLALTRGGLEALGVDVRQELAEHHAFLVGPAARAEELGDVGDSAPTRWAFGREGARIDAVVSVAADEAPDELDELVRACCDRHGGAVVHTLKGAKLGVGRHSHEHFGYRDGISQPRVAGYHDVEPAVKPGEFLLGWESESGDRDEGLGWLHNASFMVLRQLEQDVRAWRKVSEREAAGGNDRWPARVMGRQPSGRPTAPHTDIDAFDFENDRDGEHTPLDAHIRKVSPRDGAFAPQRRRLMRRGIPYGPRFEDDEEAERGLVFVAFMASIERQYEYVQRLWVNRSDFPRRGAGRDAVIGRVDPGEERYRDKNGSAPPEISSFVRTRGAVYAVAPGRRGIEALARGL